jgi:hypothetical protein
LLVGGIGLAGSLVGLTQYLRSGSVSIRPGRAPVVDAAAVEEIVVLFVVSAGFVVFGLILRSRARRHPNA